MKNGEKKVTDEVCVPYKGNTIRVIAGNIAPLESISLDRRID